METKVVYKQLLDGALTNKVYVANTLYVRTYTLFIHIGGYICINIYIKINTLQNPINQMEHPKCLKIVLYENSFHRSFNLILPSYLEVLFTDFLGTFLK